MSDTGTGGAPAGWYEDGVTAGQERFWDGTQWTDQFRPLAPAAPPVPPAPPAEPTAAAEPVAEAPTAAPAEPAPAEPAPTAAPAYPAYSAAPTAPAAQAYPAYQPGVPAAARPAGKGLSKGAIIGIVVGAVALIAAIVLILGFTVWGWAGGGGGAASSAQQQQFLSNVKSSSEVSASDAALLDMGNKLCDAGRTIVAGDYLGGMTKYLELFNNEVDLIALGNVSLYAMQDLCPDVQGQLEELGESFLP